MRKNEFYNLRIKRIRKVNTRIVCDLINGDGTLVLSGNVDWVQNIVSERGYVVENVHEADAQLDALQRTW